MAGNKQQGPVVRRPISDNPGLNFNPGHFFFSPRAFSRTISSILFRVANHQIAEKAGIKPNLLFKLSYVNSNFELTLGYLNPALNNPAQQRRTTDKRYEKMRVPKLRLFSFLSG